MSQLNETQLVELLSEADLCLLALTPGRATFVDDDPSGAPQPTSPQRLWYFGFIYGWASHTLRRMEIDNADMATAFTLRVFERLFQPIGSAIYDKAVLSIKAPGKFDGVNDAIKDFENWDGGAFVPTPPVA